MIFKKYIPLNKKTEEKEAQSAEQPVQEVVETVTCKACKKELDKKRVAKNKYVCYECGYYFRVRSKKPYQNGCGRRQF